MVDNVVLVGRLGNDPEKVTEISKTQAVGCPRCGAGSYDQRKPKVCRLCGQCWYTKTEGK